MKKAIKKHWKELLIKSVIGAIIATVILYLIVGPYNADCIEILQSISEHGIAITTCLILFPAILIIYLTYNILIIEMDEKK